MIFTPATPYCIETLLLNLRGSDRREQETLDHLLIGRPPLREQLEDLLANECFLSLYHEDTLLACGGISTAPIDARTGVIWLLGTHAFKKYRFAINRKVLRYLNRHKVNFDLIANIVPENMTHRIRWLRFLGFDIDSAMSQFLPQGIVGFSMTPHGPKTAEQPERNTCADAG